MFLIVEGVEVKGKGSSLLKVDFTDWQVCTNITMKTPKVKIRNK